MAFAQKGLHKDIFVAIRNLSRSADTVAEKAIAELERKEDAYFKKVLLPFQIS